MEICFYRISKGQQIGFDDMMVQWTLMHLILYLNMVYTLAPAFFILIIVENYNNICINFNN